MLSHMGALAKRGLPILPLRGDAPKGQRGRMAPSPDVGVGLGEGLRAAGAPSCHSCESRNLAPLPPWGDAPSGENVEKLACGSR